LRNIWRQSNRDEIEQSWTYWKMAHHIYGWYRNIMLQLLLDIWDKEIRAITLGDNSIGLKYERMWASMSASSIDIYHGIVHDNCHFESWDDQQNLIHGLHMSQLISGWGNLNVTGSTWSVWYWIEIERCATSFPATQ
jgi:hypothetical protein